MSSVENYNFKRPGKFVIENNIIKSVEAPPVITCDSLGELILEKMQSQPSFVAQIDGVTGRKETFAEMTEKSVKCAMWLKNQNVQPGDIIGICTHNQLDMYVPCFASIYIGAICNPWCDVGLSKELSTHFLTLTRPKVLFVSEALASTALEAINKISEETKVVVFGKRPDLQSLDDILATLDSKFVSEFRCLKLANLDHPCVILYTSGSTGLPKSVSHSLRSLCHNLIHPDDKNRNDKPVTTMIFSPLSWISGFYTIFRGVILRETRIVHPESTEDNAFMLYEKFKVNFTLLSTRTALKLQRSPAKRFYNLSSVKYVFVSGTMFKEDRQKALADVFPHAFIHQGYGLTEYGRAAVLQDFIPKKGPCGIVVRNTHLKIFDPTTGKALGPNQAGECCLKSPYIMLGYYNNPEATREAIDSEGWLHTGDLMKYDEEGNIFFIDRIKETIKYRGNHVPPGMIEEVLQSHPQVLEAAVLPIPHEIDEEHPIAFVATQPNATVLEEDLKKLVADTLPDYMKLRGGVKFLHELPSTSSDKVARAELRKLAKSYAS